MRSNHNYGLDMENQEKIRKIHRRQLARLLNHLDRNGQLTPALEADIKRSFGFTFGDIEETLQEHDKDVSNDPGRKQ